MNSNLDNDQLFNICAGLFKGFIEWIDVNSQNEKALILTVLTILKIKS